jgi:hypothetical protein
MLRPPKLCRTRNQTLEVLESQVSVSPTSRSVILSIGLLFAELHEYNGGKSDLIFGVGVAPGSWRQITLPKIDCAGKGRSLVGRYHGRTSILFIRRGKVYGENMTFLLCFNFPRETIMISEMHTRKAANEVGHFKCLQETGSKWGSYGTKNIRVSRLLTS